MKKCAVINDISGFGKCSLTASIPILSVMGVEAHPFPTAVLSNQTAYDSYKSVTLTDYLDSFALEWKKLNAKFDGILTGFFADSRQIDIVSNFIDDFKSQNTIVIVDPVMADNGSLYDCYNNEMCEKIKLLCKKADIITPNIAELAVLAEEAYCENLEAIISYGKKLLSQGIKTIVATGYKNDGKISNIVFSGDNVSIFTAKEQGGYYSGTGDVLASIVAGGVIRGISIESATELATGFIEKAIENTDTDNHNDGISFEKFLGDLII